MKGGKEKGSKMKDRREMEVRINAVSNSGEHVCFCEIVLS